MNIARRFALTGLLLLAACGFSPIYGTHETSDTPVAEALSNVFIDNISNEEGLRLRNRLIDRMYRNGRPTAPIAKLSVSLSFSESNLGIQKDATSSLSSLTATAKYELSQKDGKHLLSGSATSEVMYGKLSAQYGNLAAQRNAYDRAITDLAEQIVGRVSLFYAETPKEVQTAAPGNPDEAPPVTQEKSWFLGSDSPEKMIEEEEKN